MKVVIGKYPKGSDERKVSIKFDRSDFWSLDHTLALIIIPALREFKKQSCGWPGCMDYDEKGNELKGNALKGKKRWHKIIDQMIWSFEQSLNVEEYDHPLYKKDREAYWRKRQEGLQLFAEYYMALWY